MLPEPILLEQLPEHLPLLVASTLHRLLPYSMTARMCRRALCIGLPLFEVYGSTVQNWQAPEGTDPVRSFIELMNRRRPAAQHIGDSVFRPVSDLTVEARLLADNYKMNRSAILKRYFFQEPSP